MSYAFICYSSSDIQDAETIRDYVESRGFRCWMAPRDVPTGAYYPTQIVNAIKQCDAMIVIASSNLCNSGHATNEISIAFDKDKVIIPFLIEDLVFPDELLYYLNRKHWIHFHGDYKESLSTLVEDLSKWVTPTLVKKTSEEAPKPSEELTWKQVQDISIKSIDGAILNTIKENANTISELLYTITETSQIKISAAEHFIEELSDLVLNASKDKILKIEGKAGIGSSLFIQTLFFTLLEKIESSESRPYLPIYLDLKYYEAIADGDDFENSLKSYID